jgi:uncharacterized repeat protein (TIGR01451 family)
MFSIIRKVTGVVSLSILVLFVVFSFMADQARAEAAAFDLLITLKAPQHVAPGEEYVAHVLYTNLGDLASPENTAVIVTLPADVEFVSAMDESGASLPPGDISGNILTWQVGPVSAACYEHIYITVKPADDQPEETALSIQTQIAPIEGDANPDDNISTVVSQVCDMAGSSKQVSGTTVKPGDILTYTIRLRMTRRTEGEPLLQRSVQFTDTLPANHQVRFLGWNGPISGDWDGQRLRWHGQVEAGETVTLQYRLGVLGDVAPGTVITNGAELGWGGGRQLRLDPTSTNVVLPPNAAMVYAQGGKWQVHAQLSVTIPPNAIAETTRFEFQPLFIGQPAVNGPNGNLFAHQAFELNAFAFGEQHQFQQPITLTLKLGPDDIAGLRKETLRLWYRNGLDEDWQPLGNPMWLTDDTIAFTTTHFTQFALFGTGQHIMMLPLIRH